MKIWSWVPDGGLIPGPTGRLTVGRKMNFDLTRKYSEDSSVGWCQMDASRGVATVESWSVVRREGRSSRK
jgi:hypothetical protein